MANTNLTTFANNNAGDTLALSNFIVDNNPDAVFSVLKNNGYTFTTHGEASVILNKLLNSTDVIDRGIVSQIAKIPYLNNASNGTGGLVDTNAITTQGFFDALLCLGAKAFSLPSLCPGGSTTDTAAAQAAATQAAALQAAAAQKTTYIVIGVGVVLLILTVIYFSNKKTVKA